MVTGLGTQSQPQVAVMLRRVLMQVSICAEYLEVVESSFLRRYGLDE